MDMGKFYAWKYEAMIVALASASLKPLALGDASPKPNDPPYESCKPVFESLAKDGLAAAHEGGWYSLTEAGFARVPAAKREAARRLQELLKEDDRLIRKFTLRQHRKSTVYTEEEDLYQAGCIAYVHTLGKFDPSRYSTKGLGKSFTNYLESWVRHFCQQAIRGHQLIRMPLTYGMPYQMHLRAEGIRRQGREPTAEELGVSQAKLDEWAQSPVAITAASQRSGQDHDANPVGDDVDTHGSRRQQFGNAASLEPSPSDLYETAEQNAILERAMSTLKPRERQVMESFADGASYKELAKELDVSEEYVRQLRASAIGKLRDALEGV